MTEEIAKSAAKSERSFPVSSAKVLKRGTYEAGREAQDLVVQAQARAREIIEEAERERESLYRRAEAEGRTRGLAEWNEILARASERVEQLVKQWEHNMLRLSVRVAEKIVGEELKLRPEGIVGIVTEALKGARPGKLLTIRVNEPDAAYVRAHLERIKDQAGVRGEIDIATSTQVPSGGCIVESEVGIIDARLETQLQCLEDALLRDVARD